MLKKIILVFGALVLCALLFLFAHSNFGFNPNYVVAVIKSNTENLDSAISYYDENLKLLYTRKLFLGTLTNSGDCFVDLGEKKYMLSRGTYWIPCRDAIELDANTGKIKKYYIGAGHNLAMAANDKYIFNTYSLQEAHIQRCDKKTGKLKEMTVPGSCFGMCVNENNILYAFGGDSHSVISNLYIIDAEKMEILKTFDIRDKGYYQEQCMEIGDDFYFLNYIRYKGNGDYQGESRYTLTRFNTKTYEFKDIDLGIVPYQFAKFKDLIYISDRKISSDKLIIYNTKTEEINTKTVGNVTGYMAVDEKNKKLYTIGDLRLCQYDLPSLKLIKKIDSLGKDREKYSTCVVFTK